MTITINLEDCKIGDTFLQSFQFLNISDDSPIPQAGKHYLFTLKADTSKDDIDADVFVDLIVPAGSAADDGVVTIRIDKSDTLALLPTTYHHEVKEVLPSSPEDIEKTLFDGLITWGY